MTTFSHAPSAAKGVREKVYGSAVANLQAALAELHEGAYIPARTLRAAYAHFARVAQSVTKEFIADLERVIALHVSSKPNNDHLWASIGSEQLGALIGELHQEYLNQFDRNGPVHGHYIPGDRQWQDEVNQVTQAYWNLSSDLRTSAQSALQQAVANAQELDRRSRLGSLTEEAIAMATTPYKKFLLFVSYSCKDSKHPFLETLRHYFEQPEYRTFLAYFMAEDNPSFGEDFIQKVLNALKDASVVLPFITEASQLSPWVNQEIGFAQARGVPILPAFDHPHVEKLYGMIQTVDGCPVDDPTKIQSLFGHIAALAKAWKHPAAKSGFSAELKGLWWSMHANTLPLYLRIEVTHASSEPDAIKNASVEIEGRRFETLDREKLGPLNAADFKDMILKFFPTAPSGSAKARLILQTVRGKTAEITFDASASGWRPPDLWKDFKPY